MNRSVHHCSPRSIRPSFLSCSCFLSLLPSAHEAIALPLLMRPAVKTPVSPAQWATSQCAESYHSRYYIRVWCYVEARRTAFPWSHSLCPQYLNIFFSNNTLSDGPKSSPHKDSKSIQDGEQMPPFSTARTLIHIHSQLDYQLLISTNRKALIPRFGLNQMPYHTFLLTHPLVRW